MHAPSSHILAALTLALAVAVFAYDPAPVPTVEAAARAGQGLAAALAVGLAATGLGGALLRHARLGAAFGLGAGVLGLALLPLGALGLLSPWMLAGVVVAAASGWLMRPRIELPRPGPLALGVLLAVALPALLSALAPPTDTDEIYQHLALPRLMLHGGGLPGGLLHPDGSRPLPIHLLFAVALGLGGEAAPKLLHLGWAGLLVATTASLGRRLLGAPAGALAALALVGSYTFTRELGLAYNNLPTALWGLLALEAALEDRRWRMACFAGMALAAKYTAAPLIVGIYLLWWARRGLRAVPEMALLTVTALAWVAPWWLRNAATGLHPLFPYAGWPASDRFVFAYVERYGLGRDLGDLLLLPWNMTVYAETTSYTFLGRISPAGLLCLPGLVWAWLRNDSLVRPVAGVGLVAFVGWAAGPHWLRYLLPAAPVLALMVGAGYAALPRWGRAVVLAGWLAGLPSNLGPWLRLVAGDAPVAMGLQPREALLAERVPGWAAVDWVNRYAPADARVALLFAWPGYYLEKPYVLGSVEDHVPARHLLFSHGADSLRLLRELGVTHVLAGRVGFIRKSYPFLDEATFQEQFSAPEQQLQDLLLAEGVLVFESGRYGVWRLRAP
ncbi:MAG: hypothetical protein H6739_32420 [Alphaproteobacteria bacterium]|nr:hypothetical protein [Alphaproteobacteria bacterium]